MSRRGSGTATRRACSWWPLHSLALARCPLLFGVPTGGINVFGPAYVQAIGLPPPALGAGDVERLTEQYLDRFAPALSLSGAERQAVAEHLRSRAPSELAASAASGLSSCARDGGT
jgi:hypothetical protein